MKTVGIVLSCILYFFGIMFVWGAFGDPFDSGALTIGIITLIVASVILWLVTRPKKVGNTVNNVYRVDLSGEVKINAMTCKKCGGSLSADNVTMLAGAPVVTCPYCGASYQITEEPKW